MHYVASVCLEEKPGPPGMPSKKPVFPPPPLSKKPALRPDSSKDDTKDDTKLGITLAAITGL